MEVIVDCPFCKAANAGVETQTLEELGVGGSGTASMIVCRQCGRPFHAPLQVSELGNNTTQVASEMARGPSSLGDTQTALQTASGSHRLDSTGIMMPEELEQHAASMRQQREMSVPPPQPPFPAPHPPTEPIVMEPREASWHAWVATKAIVVRARWTILSPRARWAISGCAGLLLVAVMVLTVSGKRSKVVYSTEEQPMWSEPPAGGKAVAATGRAGRGVQLSITSALGPFLAVVDLQGRVGYVSREAVSPTRPQSRPELPFVDCSRGIQEADGHGCEARADEQWDACGNVCDKGDANVKCSDNCRAQYRACVAACHEQPIHPEPAATAPVVVAPPKEPAVVAPTSRVHGPKKPRGASLHEGKKRRH